MYVYNDGCDACEGYTKKIMSDPDLRKKIKENNLTLSKMVMCVPEGKEDLAFKSMGKEGKFTTCNKTERSYWNDFENKFDVDGVPALMIVDGSGSNLLYIVEYDPDPVRIFDKIFDKLAKE
jgi:thioredoxin-related protein